MADLLLISLVAFPEIWGLRSDWDTYIASEVGRFRAMDDDELARALVTEKTATLKCMMEYSGCASDADRYRRVYREKKPVIEDKAKIELLS